MRTIVYGEHMIQINMGVLKEETRYDGRVVGSTRFSWSHATHIFAVKEGGEDVQYEVNFGARGLSGNWATVRRNGKIIFSDK